MTQSQTGDPANLQCGGGTWCANVLALVTNCIIYANDAFAYGAGACGGTLKNCIIQGNSIVGDGTGGGAYGSVLNNCLVAYNQVFGPSGTGGTSRCFLTNCTLVSNFGTFGHGGCDSSFLYNCIVYFNGNSFTNSDNYYSSSMQYSCSSPLPGGTGNISTDPRFAGDGTHLSASSPCRGSGTLPTPAALTLTDKSGAMPHRRVAMNGMQSRPSCLGLP
jgi:hypothetical protein